MDTIEGHKNMHWKGNGHPSSPSGTSGDLFIQLKQQVFPPEDKQKNIKKQQAFRNTCVKRILKLQTMHQWKKRSKRGSNIQHQSSGLHLESSGEEKTRKTRVCMERRPGDLTKGAGNGCPGQKTLASCWWGIPNQGYN